MKKKKQISSIGILLSMLLTGCGMHNDNIGKEYSWIPDSLPEVQMEAVTEQQNDGSDIEDSNQTVETGNVGAHSLEELFVQLFSTDGDSFADFLWDNQRASGIYECNEQELSVQKLLTYYISDSEGDDSNSGLNPEEPKKSLEKFDGMSNVNILLKCGDDFQLSNTFHLGSNVTLAAYGDGERPVLDFYQELDVQWFTVTDYDNVWFADLSDISNLYTENTDTDNCNIGQLLIDGVCNWKRKVISNEGEEEYAKSLSDTANGAWTVDWETGVIYLHDMGNPNHRDIRYALPCHGLSLGNITDSEIRGIELTGAGCHGISMSGVQNISITNCYIHHIGGAIIQKYGTRYGNAIELWDNGENIRVAYNVAEWIYDTCYTCQGNSNSAMQKDVIFEKNVGRNSFWGIEDWGDTYSANTFENVVYRDNIIMNARDLTAPDAIVYINEAEQNIDGNGVLYEDKTPYITYRTGDYPYHQMSLLNIATTKAKDQLVISGNVFGGTNRFACIASGINSLSDYPTVEGNYFFAGIPTKEICLFRYTDSYGTKNMLSQLPVEGNQMNLQIFSEGDSSENAERYLAVVLKLLDDIANN